MSGVTPSASLAEDINGSDDHATNTIATSTEQRWHDFWHDELGQWIITRGLRVVMMMVAAALAVRFVTWVSGQITYLLDALVRSESSKHRQAVASVIQWVLIVLIAIWGIVRVADVLDVSVKGLVAPATEMWERSWTPPPRQRRTPLADRWAARP